jgi:prolyl-tRNA synthetase
VLPPEPDTEGIRDLKTVSTPNCRTIDEVTAFLSIPAHRLVKTLLYSTGKETVAVLVRGDHTVNEIKLKKVLGVSEIGLAGPATVEQVTGAVVGFAGPVGLKGLRILADHAIPALRNAVVGGNRLDTHYVDANWGRDFSADEVLDLRNAQAGDRSPRNDGTLKVTKGIEVGHVFMLGTKYSEAMKATFLDPEGKHCPAVMGCYGIGVGRTAASSIEQNHDARGIIWPYPIAPFHVHLVPVSQSDKTSQATATLYETLCREGFEVLWDDREERAGVKFNDADLIGAPFQVIVGDKGLADGVIEIKVRKTGEKSRLPPPDIAAHLRMLVASLIPDSRV